MVEPIQVLTFSPPIPVLNADANSNMIGMNSVLGLLRIIGEAVFLMNMYKCKEALEAFSRLPSNQYNSGWVLCQVARIHYEMVDYEEAKSIFEKVRKCEPYRTEGIFSQNLFQRSWMQN